MQLAPSDVLRPLPPLPLSLPPVLYCLTPLLISESSVGSPFHQANWSACSRMGSPLNAQPLEEKGWVVGVCCHFTAL